MAGSFGEVFVMDWGVARSFDAVPRHTAGTPAYMAPEQAAPGNSPIDVRSDIFALGRILHELLPATPPRPLAAIAAKASAAEPSARMQRRIAPPPGSFSSSIVS